MSKKIFFTRRRMFFRLIVSILLSCSGFFSPMRLNWFLEHTDEAHAMRTKAPHWIAKNRVYNPIAETAWNQYQNILKVNA
ncbi:MAG: hypothetical protein HOO87_08055 [Methyloglobulus sp.]|nr:hypothetical protein [Methyloglobulus sp.]